MKKLKILPRNHKLIRTVGDRYGIIIGVLFAMSFIAAGCATQTKVLSFGMGNALSSPRFGFFIVNCPSSNPDSSEGDLYARVRYDNLIFIKTDLEFTAHYQLSVNLYLDRGLTESRYSKSFDRQITVTKYSQALASTMYDTLKDKLVVKPGEYFAVLRLLDLNTNVTSSKELKYTFKGFFNHSVNISDIVLHVPLDTNGFPIEFVRNDFNLFADFYVTAMSVPTTILLHMIAKSTEAPSLIDTTFKLDQIYKVQHYRLPVNVNKLAPATYDLRVSVGENFTETSFSILRHIFLPGVAEFEREDAPLQYTMTPSGFDSLRDASHEEREKILKTFWVARSHGDTTIAMAMQKEFYKRVEAADAEFGTTLTPGWQTDRGKIYILYGKPDQIENHGNDFRMGPAANSPPNQVWYYNSLKLRFVFVDELRNGDYRLAKTDGT